MSFQPFLANNLEYIDGFIWLLSLNNMKTFLSRRWIIITLLAFLCVSSGVRADDDLKAAADGLLRQLKEKYDSLSDHGKFATGAVVGFGISRITVKSAVGIVKVAGAAYVA